MDFLEVSSTKMSRDSLVLIAVRYLQATDILTVRVLVASQTFSGNGLAVEWLMKAIIFYIWTALKLDPDGDIVDGNKQLTEAVLCNCPGCHVYVRRNCHSPRSSNTHH